MMHVLIDNSGYRLTNYGDVAMLQVAVERVAELWPEATIEVITADPEHLSRFCPKAQPLIIPSLEQWYSIRDIASEQIDLVAGFMRLAKKKLVARVPGLQPKNLHRTWNGYLEGVERADLVLASGGGYINDTFVEHGFGILQTLSEALRQGKPAAMMSNGFEPLTNPAIRTMAQTVLPQLDLVGCREKRFSPVALRALGVDPNRIRVTGDDAIELGYQVRPETLGTGIGVNLRVAWYSGVGQRMLTSMRDILHEAARSNHAPLIPLPISMASPSDAASIEKLIAGYDGLTSDGGASLDSPMRVIEQASRCRIVLTGSYHAGVFALSQGIPAVCLGQSSYYMQKFEGLKAQFGDGCYVLSPGDADFEVKLAQTLRTAWDRADETRPSLLQAASDQIALSRAAYQEMAERVGVQQSISH